jgi:hypothetical protein
VNGKGAYLDPVTGVQRILIHLADGEYHVNNAVGERFDLDGNVVDARSPRAHLPLG